MRLRNNIFAAALDELKRRKVIATQKDLAKLMGVSEDTITRILKDRTDVTEDVITKLQTASGCIFNLQWLRGEDPYNMLIEDLIEERALACEPHQPASVDTDFYRQLLQARDSHIADLNRQLDNANALVLDYGAKITELNELIADLREQNGSLSSRVEYYKQMADVEKTRTDEVKTQLDDLRGALVGKQNVIDSLNKQISLMDVELKARRENPLLGHPFPTGVAEEPKNK